MKIIDERKVDSKNYFQLAFDEGEKLGSVKDHAMYHGLGTPYIGTVTDLANFCVTPLFRRPQGSHGCLEKQNYPLSSNLVVWCAKIGSKTKKVII